MKEVFYVVLCDYAIVDHDGGEGSDIDVTAVCRTLEEAKIALSEAVKAEREYAKANNWHIAFDTDNEFYAHGLYEDSGDHVHFFIRKVEREVSAKDNTKRIPRVVPPVKVGDNITNKDGKKFMVLGYEYKDDGRVQSETVRVVNSDNSAYATFTAHSYNLKEFYEEFPDCDPDNKKGGTENA